MCNDRLHLGELPIQTLSGPTCKNEIILKDNFIVIVRIVLCFKSNFYVKQM